MRPLTLRPPVFFIGAVRDFSGSVFVISSNVETVMKRRPGLVGLNFFSAISGHLPGRSRSPAVKTERRKDAGSARSRRLRARLRTPRGEGLQPSGGRELRGRG